MSNSAVLFLELAAIAIVFAGIPLAYLFSRPSLNLFQRLNWTIVFLTFDLIVFGAFTRLSDSGLGCPDWPGCYGTSNPFRAMEQIRLAEAAMPDGPVTEVKAWIEMLHRYLAMTVGALIVLQVGLAIAKAKELGTKAVVGSLVLLVLVCLQGAFGAWTVTLKLQPIIVSIHLMLALILLALLTWYAQQPWQERGSRANKPLLSGKLLAVSFGILFWQVFLGAWVSTNYAVLACPDFPTCMGSFTPETDWRNAFTLWRELGLDAQGAAISTIALQTIHWTHRVFAIAVMVVLGYFAWHAWRAAGQSHPRLGRWALAVITLLVLQVLTGISNVVFQWPLVAALLHTAGAAALVLCLVRMSAWASWGYSVANARRIP
jgi:cytochrome c oxidase assembly protein subunit 15